MDHLGRTQESQAASEKRLKAYARELEQKLEARTRELAEATSSPDRPASWSMCSKPCWRTRHASAKQRSECCICSRAKLDRHSSADGDLFYWRLTLEFGLKRVAAAEAWAIEALAALDSVTPASSGPARPKKRKKHTRKRSSKK
jgi:hypothetical protein